jgi:hypothetical protein
VDDFTERRIHVTAAPTTVIPYSIRFFLQTVKKERAASRAFPDETAQGSAPPFLSLPVHYQLIFTL